MSGPPTSGQAASTAFSSTSCRSPDGATSIDRICTTSESAAPRARSQSRNGIRQGLRAAFHLQIAAQDAPAVRGQALDRSPRAACRRRRSRQRRARGTAARSTGRAPRRAAPAARAGMPASGDRTRPWTGDSSISATRPSARWIRREQRAARCGSWVISISVVPVSARRRNSRSITASPVAWSRLPVGSSASSSRGRGAKARASATRCCSPPESWPGRWVSRCAKPDRIQRLARSAMASRTPGQFQRHGDILQRRHGRDQVERLEHDADRRRAAGGPARPRPSPVTAWPASRMLPAVARSSPASTISRLVLPEPDGPDDADRLARRDVEVDAAQDVDRPRRGRHGQVQVPDLDERHCGGGDRRRRNGIHGGSIWRPRPAAESHDRAGPVMLAAVRRHARSPGAAAGARRFARPPAMACRTPRASRRSSPPPARPRPRRAASSMARYPAIPRPAGWRGSTGRWATARMRPSSNWARMTGCAASTRRRPRRT